MARVQPDIVFVDANGRVGNTITDRIGAEGFPQDEDQNGAELATALAERDLLATTTILPTAS